MARTTTTTGEVGRHLRQLFDAGSAVGLSDGELLERFAAAGDDAGRCESAFEAIVARHGPAVLSVCRQVLGDSHAAEDAFQATFLVLVRRSGSLRIRAGGSLGAWLYGVACRTAMKARKATMRRRVRERRAARPEARAGTAIAEVEAADAGIALHAEVVRLPARYREAVVLCYFEGRTHDEAAATIGCPVGTVRGRLARARDLLRGRLTRRGLAPSMAGLTTAGLEARAVAIVPPSLLRATLGAALDQAHAGAARSMIAVLQGIAASRPTSAITIAAAVGLVAVGIALRMATGSPVASGPIAPVAPIAAAAETPAPDEPLGDPLPPHGRVRLGSDAFRHGVEVNEVFVPRDGKRLVTIDSDRVIHIWDAATGRSLHRIELAGRNFARIALSPDGKTIATTEPSPEHRLRLWDVATGRERRRLHTPRDESCDCPIFTPDGRSLITLGSVRQGEREPGQSPRCFDIRDLTASGARRRQLVGNWGGIWEFDVSPDGRTIAAIDDRVYVGGRAVLNRPHGVAMRGAIDLVDIATGRLRLVLGAEGLSIRSQAFSPDSTYLAVGFDDGTVRVYDTADGRERLPRMVHRVPVGPPPPRSDPEEERRMQASGRWSPLPISSAYANWLEVIDALAFSPDGKILAGGSRLAAVTPSRGSLFFWDFARGDELRRVEGFPAGPISLAFSADGRTIAVAGTNEPRPRIWEVATGREVLPQAGHLRAILALAISPRDGTVFTGGRDGTVRRWDASTGRELAVIARFEGRTVDRLAIAPDGRTLVIQGNFGDPVVWSVAEGRELAHLAGFAGGTPLLFPIACSPDGRSALFGRTIWDLATGERRAELHIRDDPGPVSVWVSLYHPDGRPILSTGPGFIWAWDAATGEDQGVVMRNEALRYGLAAISPDGHLLATSPLLHLTDPEPAERWIDLWDLSTGREAARLPAHGGAGRGLAFSPDGRLLVEFRSDNSAISNASEPDPREPAIWIWNIAARRELREFNGHRGRVNAAAFTPDGRALITAGDEGTAMVWDISDLAGR